MRLFALHSSRFPGEKIATFLNRSLDAHEDRNFEDGEHKIRLPVSVRDEDVYVIHSLYSDDQESVHDKLCKLLFFIATLKDSGTQRITAIIPYLCYARKGRRTKARDPVTMRYGASLFEAMNADGMVAIDVHNLQTYQNAFQCQAEHLEAQNVIVNYFRRVFKSHEKVVVMSPDIGGIKRAEHFRERLAKGFSAEVGFAFMEKLRSKGVVSGEAVVGDVTDKYVIILDDLISSGATMARAAAAWELSPVMVECEVVHVPATGQLFLNSYYWKSRDKIPDTLMDFIKAKRAFVLAKLSIQRLKEEKYHSDAQKWKDCATYLKTAFMHSDQLSKDC